MDDFTRLGFLTLYQFQLETMLRDLLVAMNPPKLESAFYSIAKKVLELSGVPDPDRKRAILNAPALLRNSLHTNGIHNPPSNYKTPVTVDIGGVIYRFVDQDRVTCAGWAYILHALQAGLDVIDEVLFSAAVTTLPSPVKSRYAELRLAEQ